MEKLSTSTTLTEKQVFLVWLPLAAMWIIMGVEQPFIAAFIARMPEAKLNLAAFGVIFSLALIIESPIVQMLSASTAIADSKANYRKLLSFMHILALGLTLIHILVALPIPYQIIMKNIIGAPEEIIEPSRKAFLVMIPFSAAVGYRRLWQGVLIRYKRTSVIPITMIVRLITMVGLVLMGFFTNLFPGAITGALALSGGIITGAIASYFYARPIIKKMIEQDPVRETYSWKNMAKFYVPLAMTSIIMLSARPLLTFGIARAPYPLVSLAVWPVITGFLFIFNSLALSLQEVVISVLDSNEAFPVVRRFTRHISFTLGFLFLSITLSPLRDIWFAGPAGLSEDLLDFIPIPVIIISFIPSIVSFLSYFRGIQVRSKRTVLISTGVTINFITLVIVMFITASILPVSGAISASIAMAVSMIIEAIYHRIVLKHRPPAPI